MLRMILKSCPGGWSKSGKDLKILKEADHGSPTFFVIIRNKLRDDGTHRNVKLFLLRLILNCAETFKPFAKHFGRDILNVIVCDTTWGSAEVTQGILIESNPF
jgi:hypothetical protein